MKIFSQVKGQDTVLDDKHYADNRLMYLSM